MGGEACVLGDGAEVRLGAVGGQAVSHHTLACSTVGG